MSRLAFISILLFIFLCVNNSFSNNMNEIDQLSIDKVNTTDERVLRHVVVFKYKESATSKQIDKINLAFVNLKNEIPQIRDFEWGLNNSPEGLDQDFTHCYLVTFHSEKDRDIYLPHPAHKAFVELIGPYIEKVFVVDYWTEEL